MKSHFVSKAIVLGVAAVLLMLVSASRAVAQEDERPAAEDSTSSNRQLQRSARPKPVLIDDVEEAKVAMHPARFYLESSTVMIADIDLEKIRPNTIADWLAGQRNTSSEKLKQGAVVQMAAGTLQSLRDAGVRHAYLTLATRSLPDRGPLLILPCDEPEKVKETVERLLAAVPEELDFGVVADENVVLAGPNAAIERVHETTEIERPELLRRLASTDRLDHHAVFSLPSEARQELIALWPDQAPKASPIAFSPRGLVTDLQSLTLSWSLPPEPSMIATVEATDDAAAERLKELVGKVLDLAPTFGETLMIRSGGERFTVETTRETIAMMSTLLLGPVVQQVKQNSLSNQMKQLALAIHNYHSASEHVPPRCFTDRQGNPLLSGRVAMLPYLELQTLYEQFQLGQPWDSPANRKWLEEMPEVFASDDAASAEHKTRFRMPSFPGSLWHGDGPPKRYQNVTDGLSNTIAMIHAPADAAVEWTDPTEWKIDPEDPASDIFGDRDEVTILMLDGSVRTWSREKLPNEKLKALLTIAGGERVDF